MDRIAGENKSGVVVGEVELGFEKEGKGFDVKDEVRVENMAASEGVNEGGGVWRRRMGIKEGEEVGSDGERSC